MGSKALKLLPWLTFATLAALVLIAGTGVLAEDAADTGGNWPHFGYDDAYTAYNPIESTISITNVAELERKWDMGYSSFCCI